MIDPKAPEDNSPADKAPEKAPINPDDLHDLFAGTPTSEATDDEDPLAELRKDPNYAALIGELEYIAAQARALFAPVEEEPSDDLWKKIEKQLPTKPEE